MNLQIISKCVKRGFVKQAWKFLDVQRGAKFQKVCSDDLAPMGSMAGLQYGSLSGHAGSVSSEWSATRMQYFIVWPESPPRADEPGRFQLHKVYKLG